MSSWPMPDHLKSSILSRLKDGLTYAVIAKEHGISIDTVGRLARGHGMRRSFPPAMRSAKERIQIGSLPVSTKNMTVSTFVLTLPEDVIEWLDKETPKGSRMCDLIRAIIIDAYNGER